MTISQHTLVRHCCAAAFVSALLSACSAHAPAASPQLPAPAKSTTIKHPLRGLVTQGDQSFLLHGGAPNNTLVEANAHPNIYSAVVINATWAQLEPAQFAFDFAAIDQGLDNVTTYNLAHPDARVVAKLRIFGGQNIPPWVMALSGGPVHVENGKNERYTIGHFWNIGYRTAWAQLQQVLAARYDNDPLVGEVAVTSCSTVTGEPFVMPLLRSAIAALHRAGMTDALRESCLLGAIGDYAAWKITPVDYTFNNFSDTDSGHAVADPSFTLQTMTAWRAAMGPRGVIANHGLVSPLQPNADPVYAEFSALKAPLEFQLLAPAGIDIPAAIALGLTYQPSEIEIFDTIAAGGHADISTAQLTAWANALRPGAPRP